MSPVVITTIVPEPNERFNNKLASEVPFQKNAGIRFGILHRSTGAWLFPSITKKQAQFPLI
jgi:hypothetical protein